MSTNDTIIGIDLGTTFSAVGVVQREGHPVILPNKQERIMPSVVGLSPQGEWLVGTPALNQWVLAPEATVRSIKRDMGTDRTVTLGEHTFTPQEISAFILRELKRVAEVNLGHPVKRAVITVPAYFSDAARQATKDAGQIVAEERRGYAAGDHVLRYAEVVVVKNRNKTSNVKTSNGNET